MPVKGARSHRQKSEFSCHEPIYYLMTLYIKDYYENY